jgi:hypothetical protein
MPCPLRVTSSGYIQNRAYIFDIPTTKPLENKGENDGKQTFSGFTNPKTGSLLVNNAKNNELYASWAFGDALAAWQKLKSHLQKGTNTHLESFSWMCCWLRLFCFQIQLKGFGCCFLISLFFLFYRKGDLFAGRV